MDTTQFTSDELAMLATLLTQYRAHSNEHNGLNFSNRDALAKKLAEGGELDKVDVFMLRAAVGNEGDAQTWQTFASRLARR